MTDFVTPGGGHRNGLAYRVGYALVVPFWPVVFVAALAWKMVRRGN